MARRYAFRWTDDGDHPGTSRAFLVEFIGTAIFVFASEGSFLAIGKNYKDVATAGDLVVVALASSLAFSVAVSIALNVSGGHLNPAVTLGALVVGSISVYKAFLYWLAQLLGAVIAVILLWISTGGMRPVGFAVAAGVGRGNAVVLEMVLTFGLVFTVYATTIDPKRGGVGTIAPLIIGFIVGANTLVGRPFDGAAMNPALAFGPALVGWRWLHHWVFWVGPFLGGALAAVVYEFLMIPTEAPHPHHQALAPEDYMH